MITEQQIVNLVTESIEKSDLIKYIEKDKDFEKRVKKIASEVITELFRVLWQHNALFKNLSK